MHIDFVMGISTPGKMVYILKRGPVSLCMVSLKFPHIFRSISFSVLLSPFHSSSIILYSFSDYLSFLNSLVPGKFKWNFRHLDKFQTDFSNWWLRHLLWNCPNMNVTGLHWWSVNIVSDNGLVPSGNKPLSEPRLTQISVAIWRH